MSDLFSRRQNIITLLCLFFSISVSRVVLCPSLPWSVLQDVKLCVLIRLRLAGPWLPVVCRQSEAWAGDSRARLRLVFRGSSTHQAAVTCSFPSSIPGWEQLPASPKPWVHLCPLSAHLTRSTLLEIAPSGNGPQLTVQECILAGP